MYTDTKMSVLYSREDLNATVKKLAGKITRTYSAKNPLVVGILKGSFIFMSDLIRQLDFPLEIEFIRLSSYGSNKQSSGSVSITSTMTADVTGRHVLIVEDIIDSGISLAFLLDYFKAKKPTSLKLCCLLDKPSRRQVPVKVDYTGLIVPDKFLVGYGLDWDEKFRNLPEIYALEE